jgi:hypothetical protein
MEPTTALPGNTNLPKPTNSKDDSNIAILLTNYSCAEYRWYESFVRQYGNPILQSGTAHSIVPNKVPLTIVPNRFVNDPMEKEHDYLLDSHFFVNSLLKNPVGETLFFGKSGIYNLNVNRNFISGSEAYKNAYKTSITTEGRLLLDIPADVEDKIFISLKNTRLPKRICVPDKAIILATVKVNGIDYCAAYYDYEKKICCHFGDPVVMNLEKSFAYKFTSLYQGDLLSIYIMKFLMQSNAFKLKKVKSI